MPCRPNLCHAVVLGRQGIVAACMAWFWGSRALGGKALGWDGMGWHWGGWDGMAWHWAARHWDGMALGHHAVPIPCCPLPCHIAYWYPCPTHMHCHPKAFGPPVYIVSWFTTNPSTLLQNAPRPTRLHCAINIPLILIPISYTPRPIRLHWVQLPPRPTHLEWLQYIPWAHMGWPRLVREIIPSAGPSDTD